MRLDPRLFRGHVESRSAINSIVIEQRHRWHFQLSATGDQAFGQGRAFKETECRAGMKFDILRH
jgi:hypothetical protein